MYFRSFGWDVVSRVLGTLNSENDEHRIPGASVGNESKKSYVFVIIFTILTHEKKDKELSIGAHEVRNVNVLYSLQSMFFGRVNFEQFAGSPLYIAIHLGLKGNRDLEEEIVQCYHFPYILGILLCFLFEVSRNSKLRSLSL